MKYEAEFRLYLKKFCISKKTGENMSAKVASDTLSRCRRVESYFSYELSPAKAMNDTAHSNLLKKIKEAKISSTDKRPYLYAQLVHAVNKYKDFAFWYTQSSPQQQQHYQLKAHLSDDQCTD